MKTPLKISSDDHKGLMKELNVFHAAIMLGGKFSILTETLSPATGLPEIQFSSVADMRNFYRNQKVETMVGNKIKLVNPAEIWLDHPNRRQYKGVVFAPDEVPDGYYNLFKGFAVEPKKGNCKLFMDHILNNICAGNESYFEWLFDWMADAVQNPTARPGTAVVLRGVQGTGKGIFATFFGKIFGSHFVHVSGQHRLTGRFNNHLKMGLIVFVDEGFWAGDRRDTGTLKAMITEKFMLIEPKFQDAFALRNYIRVIMASNNDWVVPADIEERRFFVIDVSDRNRMDTEYFGKIVKEMENGGMSALLYQLSKRKIKSNLREVIRTDALYDQILESMSALEKWWLTCLIKEKIVSDDTTWPEFHLPDTVYNSYLYHCTKVHERHPAGFPELFRKLRKICPDIRLRKLDPDHSGTRKNYTCFPDLQEAREGFEDRINMVINWEEDEVPF